MVLRAWGGMAALAMLASCSTAVVPRPQAGVPATSQPAVRQPVAATPMPAAPAPAITADIGTARAANLVAGPDIATLPFDEAAAVRALSAFRTSCPSLVRRTDASGLTRGADWQAACADAAADDARAFFA